MPCESGQTGGPENVDYLEETGGPFCEYTMTIAQLLVELSKYPLDAEVLTVSDYTNRLIEDYIKYVKGSNVLEVHA